jgi:hypothetical protein
MSFWPGWQRSSLCHITLVVRHAWGLREALKGSAWPKLRRNLVITGLVALSITCGIVAWAWPTMLETDKIPRDLVYMGVLTLPLWMGWSTVLHDRYPRDNAWMIAVGITFFYVCDTALGLGTESSGTLAEIFALVPDITYTPALMLLAISGYFWDLAWIKDP